MPVSSQCTVFDCRIRIHRRIRAFLRNALRFACSRALALAAARLSFSFSDKGLRLAAVFFLGLALFILMVVVRTVLIESGKMKVRASERDASVLAISQRAQPKFNEVKVEDEKMKDESHHPDGNNFHLSSFNFPLNIRGHPARNGGS